MRVRPTIRTRAPALLFTTLLFATMLFATMLAAACGARSSLRVPTPSEAEGGSGGVPPDVPECAVYNSAAALAPLDVFLMVDSSGSMQLPIQGTGGRKWDAIQQAFSSFFYDRESVGIGVALSFFPIVNDSIPAVCTVDVDCNSEPWGCTLLDVCPSIGAACSEDSDCAALGAPGDTCEQLGYCAAAGPTETCIPSVGLDCPDGFGPCVDYGYCEDRFTCDSDPYQEPVLDILALPQSASPMLQFMAGHWPQGATPTLPALTGSVDHAIDWSLANPTHKVIVVLATDGFPTVCDADLGSDPGQEIANLAAVAATAADFDIQTFVIGVFSEQEANLAQSNLDAIALAGDTDSAFVVTDDSSVSSQFLEAMNQVRLTAKSCEFKLAETDDPIDYSTVWVYVTPLKPGEDGEWVPRVASVEACSSGQHGFYFDAPPDGPIAPKSVILCPTSCALLGASPNRTVEIYTTCQDPPQG